MISVDAVVTRPGFSLDVAFASDARVTGLFGRSGSGKSTTIGVIAGLVRPERGRVVVDGTVLLDTERRIFVPVHKRRIGLVFQDAQLFPHLTVRQNLDYGRRFAAVPDQAIEPGHVIETLGIGHLLERMPDRLSGGERQRVAIGRALLASPRLLLLDEPLASLDGQRKREILPLIEMLAATHEVPVVYVSHAIEEVTRLAAKVVVMEAGQVIAQGAPETVFPAIAPHEAADRFALASVITGRLGAYDEAFALTPLDHPAGRLYLSGRMGSDGAEARVVVRATDVALATQRPRSLSIRNVLEGTVARVHLDAGPVATVDVALSGHGRLAATVTRLAVEELGLGEGDRVFALVKTAAIDERPSSAAG